MEGFCKCEICAISGHFVLADRFGGALFFANLYVAVIFSCDLP
jgi:hypothetical protein